MNTKWLLLLALPALATAPLSAKDEPSDKGKATERQRERAAEENKDKARDAWQKDGKKLKGDELESMEGLYQKANENPRTPENQELLKQVIEKYPKSNRAGCAACYIGQFSRDPDESREYLEMAIKEYSDCYYLNGTSVGGWARLLLAGKEKQRGDAAKAKKLMEEIRKDYATATDHRGELLVNFLDKE
ncbi:hypothetical protein JIN84_00895 [Luteolibacter yonseiensis]|uniref:Tetratricopeptide repeat protein n=1 Tax=Luteolibacter yonseiensis TaxID=1144680 RepID=A0A934R2L4_9BACT|nr:hypothetical protein [Luteolibacter yonseiensis]MBK1814165.1 hypothetical protein [Luteolibacter yonseiensis]